MPVPEIIQQVVHGEPSPARYREAATRARWSLRIHRRQGATVFASGRLFQAWIDKSEADLALLTTELPTGPYPYAGIPWFSTPFGRDAVITALQTLWLDPALARGVLAFLAPHQATETSPFSDAEPGRSCTRPARAKWRRCASCRSAATTAASIPRRCS